MQKSIVIILVCLTLLDLLLLPTSKGEDEYQELDFSRKLFVIVDQDDIVDFQNKIKFKNPTDHSIEVYLGIPIIWPYDLNSTQYSYYPFQAWMNITEDVVDYKHVNDTPAALMMPQYLIINIDSYPMIPHLLFDKAVNTGETNGISIRTMLTNGIISKTNGNYNIKIQGAIQKAKNEIEVKLPLEKLNQNGTLSKLKVYDVSPLYPKEEDQSGYRIFTWDEDFLTSYFANIKENLTLHNISISYTYEPAPSIIKDNGDNNDILKIFLGVVSGIIVILIGVIYRKVIIGFVYKKVIGKIKGKK